jgi:hypothetical protein
MLPEKPQKLGFYALRTHVEQSVAAEQTSAEVIEDGEGIAIDPVPHQELSLEVDGPDLVRRGGVEGDRTGVLPSAPGVSRPDTAVTFQDVEDGASSRPEEFRMLLVEALQDLPSPPSIPLVLLEDESDKMVRGLMRTRPGRPTVLAETWNALLHKPINPFVSGRSADTVPLAQFGHRPMAAFEIMSKMVSFKHRIGLRPWHLSSLR